MQITNHVMKSEIANDVIKYAISNDVINFTITNDVINKEIQNIIFPVCNKRNLFHVKTWSQVCKVSCLNQK